MTSNYLCRSKVFHFMLNNLIVLIIRSVVDSGPLSQRIIDLFNGKSIYSFTVSRWVF